MHYDIRYFEINIENAKFETEFQIQNTNDGFNQIYIVPPYINNVR